MHRMNLRSRLLLPSLFLIVGLGAFVSWVGAQPPAPAAGGEEKEKVLNIPVETFKLLQAARDSRSPGVRNENPKVITVEEIKGNPFVIKVTGVQPGSSTLIITDEKNNVEIRDIHVLDTDDELFQLERRKLEGSAKPCWK